MKMELKTRKSNFHRIGAQYRVLEAVESALTTVLANSRIVATVPTTVDLESQVCRKRATGDRKCGRTQAAFQDFFVLFPFPF